MRIHARLHDAGIGIIAMEAPKGGEEAILPAVEGRGLSFAQSSIRWALDDKRVSTVVCPLASPPRTV